MLRDLMGGQAIEISTADLVASNMVARRHGVCRRGLIRRRSCHGVFLIPRLGGSSRFIAGGSLYPGRRTAVESRWHITNGVSGSWIRRPEASRGYT